MINIQRSMVYALSDKCKVDRTLNNICKPIFGGWQTHFPWVPKAILRLTILLECGFNYERWLTALMDKERLWHIFVQSLSFYALKYSKTFSSWLGTICNGIFFIYIIWWKDLFFDVISGAYFDRDPQFDPRFYRTLLMGSPSKAFYAFSSRKT